MGAQWCGFDEIHTGVCIKGHVSRGSLQADCIRVFLIVLKSRENTYRSVIVEYFLFPDLKIATISTIFMLSGTVPVKNDWLKICARGTATSRTVVLIIFIDMLSNPSLVLDFRFLVTFMISCSSVLFMKKLVWQLSVRESEKSIG